MTNYGKSGREKKTKDGKELYANDTVEPSNLGSIYWLEGNGLKSNVSGSLIICV